VEFRQLRYFATLAEELHFGRAAAREHIVQSALSQQISRLERELGVPLVERSTHHVRLAPAGEVFLAEARQILDHLERAKTAARSATASSSALRVAVGDASFASMPQVLQAVQVNRPNLEIHRIEACVPEQCRLLADCRLDIGFGRASRVPREVASEVLRLDRMGVLVAQCHPLTRLESVPVAHLAGESLLLAEDARAPEFNEFVSEMCRSAGFTPTPYRGTVQSVRAAADLVADGRCVVCVPRSCGPAPPGTVWVPLADPVARYPWSLLWRADDRTALVRAVRDCARMVSRQRGWMDTNDAELPAMQDTRRLVV
jgi:DNA-binding transcriptional LysR family regulator